MTSTSINAVKTDSCVSVCVEGNVWGGWSMRPANRVRVAPINYGITYCLSYCDGHCIAKYLTNTFEYFTRN